MKCSKTAALVKRQPIARLPFQELLIALLNLACYPENDNQLMMEMAFLDHEHSCTHVPVPISTFNKGNLAPPKTV
jgi:hypothetical protein